MIKNEVVITHKQVYRVFVNGDDEGIVKQRASKIIIKNGDLNKKYLVSDDLSAEIIGKQGE